MVGNISLKELKKSCDDCCLCELSKTRSNVVFGRGSSKAKILFIGEAPGEKEDLEGIPFVGRAGKKLSKSLDLTGIYEMDIYIANILKCRPPKNRNPKKEEICVCTPHLIAQIRIIKPKIIATLGNFSTKFILSYLTNVKMSKIEGIATLHGSPIKIKHETLGKLVIFPIYHPSATMYNPKLIEAFDRDFENMKKILK